MSGEVLEAEDWSSWAENYLTPGSNDGFVLGLHGRFDHDCQVDNLLSIFGLFLIMKHSEEYLHLPNNIAIDMAFEESEPSNSGDDPQGKI